MERGDAWRAQPEGSDKWIDTLVADEEGTIWARGWDDPDALLAAYLLATS